MAKACVMLPFLRSDLAQLVAYIPYLEDVEVGSEAVHPIVIDRLDRNESPDDLEQELACFYQHQVYANRYSGCDHRALQRAIAPTAT